MSIRLDPRRLSALKLLAAEAGVRPGELVTSWVEERLDAARAGRATGPGASAAALAELTARVDELARRMDEMTNGTQAAEPAPASEPAPVSPREVEVEPGPSEESPGPPARRPRGRPRKAAADAERQAPAGAEIVPGSRTPLHDEIAAVIRERGPMTAADIATAIGERGRYAPPRSSRPLDAATINSRVSNPAYRALFARDGRRIGLAETG
ncbi:MAG TPA: hypothetical protein VHK63_04460 [Candidatus Limnocylindria bacterium]|nr:hypothetical protein [Candidatus Limnocylindria bacterium]